MPRLLKTGVTLALSCAALAHSPRAAQAQTTKAPLLSFGVPMFGPAPISDVENPDVCWAPGTPPAKVAAFERAHPDDGSSVASPFRVLGQGRWSRTATDGGGLTLGQPTTLRYSFVPDGQALPRDGGEPSNLQARLDSIYGSRAAWLAVFARVGQALSAQSGLTYVYEPEDDGAPFGSSSGEIGVRGDLRISGHRIDGNFGVLAYNFSPDNGDMVIDTSDVFFEDRRSDDLGIRNTVTHEFGHGVGLAHTCPINESKLMEPTVTYAFDGPQFDDIRGLQRFYGDPLEDNDSTTVTTDLGTLQNGTVTPGAGKILSIDDGGDSDFFGLTLTPNKSISITMTPVGQPYLEGPQNDDASCSAGVPLDPKVINNLGFELLKADGAGFSTVATADAAPAGGTETLAPRNFPAGGQFRIRVFGVSDAKDVQTYSLQVTVSGPVTQPTAGPTPTPGPTAGPTATPLPQPTAIRPIIDLNGLNADEAQGQDSANPSGIDNTAIYNYRTFGIKDDGTFGVVGQGGAQLITPPREIVISDISSTPVIPGSAIVEARVELTPDVACGNGSGIDPGGIAPDNCNPQNKRDNEVLGVNADRLKAVNDGLQQNISAAYDVNTQILTLKGGVRSNDEIRNAYQQALKTVTYENKLPITDANSPFNREPNLRDRIITYVVDTDNDATNNQDSRFGFVDGPNSNSKQSKPAVLTLSFRERQSLVVTTTEESVANDNETSLREAIEYANTIPFANPDPDPKKPDIPTPPSIITFAPNVRGIIDLAGPLPAINNRQKPLTIQGPGARLLTVNGSGSGSVFQVITRATISGLTITGGNAQGGANTGIAVGGGIYAAPGSALNVDACTLTGNGAQLGGGIGNIGGDLTVTNSTISGNSASNGGGGLYLRNVANGANGSASIVNSTISGNSGSGIAQVSGASTVRSSTITDNAPAGVATSGGSINLGNTVVSGNASDNDVTRTGGNVTSGGYNIVGSGNAATAFTPASNDIPNVTGNRAGLGVLGNNGGPTNTHALFAGSLAVDAGDPAFTAPPATDQRGTGFERVINNRIDIGAYEKQDDTPIVNPVISPRNPTTNQTITVNPNSDTTNLRYQFFVTDRFGRRTAIDQNNRLNTLDLSVPGQGDSGDTISVTVLAVNDARTQTAEGTDSVVVADSPTSFTLALSATNPAPNQRSTEILTKSLLTVTPTSTDPDNDPITFIYRWSVNGQVRPQERDQTIDLAKPGNGDRDDIVSVDVTAFNAATGENPVTQTISTSVGNTAPIAQNVTFNVTAGQTVRILLRATDDDTRQPSAANPNGVDTLFRYTARSQARRGTFTIETNSDGRDVLIYTADVNGRGPDTIAITATDTIRYDGKRLRVGPGYRTGVRGLARATVIPAPRGSARSGLQAPPKTNPSGGSS